MWDHQKAAIKSGILTTMAMEIIIHILRTGYLILVEY